MLNITNLKINNRHSTEIWPTYKLLHIFNILYRDSCSLHMYIHVWDVCVPVKLSLLRSLAEPLPPQSFFCPFCHICGEMPLIINRKGKGLFWLMGLAYSGQQRVWEAVTSWLGSKKEEARVPISSGRAHPGWCNFLQLDPTSQKFQYLLAWWGSKSVYSPGDPQTWGLTTAT